MTRRLRTIPLPTTATPRTKPMKTTPVGVVWNPPRLSTKNENLVLLHAQRHNKVARDLSILNTRSINADDS